MLKRKKAYIKALESVWKHIKAYKSILKPLKAFESIWKRMMCMKAYKSIWKCLKAYESIWKWWKRLKAYESVWKHLKVIEIVYNFCNSNLAEACINDCSAHAYKLPSIYMQSTLYEIQKISLETKNNKKADKQKKTK